MASFMMMIQRERDVLHIPDWVRDLASFRQWAKSEAFPSSGWYAHLSGRLWVDPSLERVAHNLLKVRFLVILAALVEEAQSGHYFGDRLLLTHGDAGLSTEPDGMFVSYTAIREGRARLADREDSLEIEGSPDMVLEVVSPSSVRKDTIVLRDLYWQAGVREYWLANPRGDDLTFDILKRGPKGYVATRRQGGWLKSAVFGKSFQLTGQADALGMPVYTLAVR